MRANALSQLLSSIKLQTFQPNEVLIIDGSIDSETKKLCQQTDIENLHYYMVDNENRGLTKQRNFGVARVSEASEIICFLDDDVILENDYFENLISTYRHKPDAIAAGGYITNEVQWKKSSNKSNANFFCMDGYCRVEPKRFRVRAWLGLAPDRQPCYLPTFSHGRSVSFLPPTGSIYEVEHFMGGVASYRKHIFRDRQFSKYFEGYGLYEDADFCFRIKQLGSLYVNTGARLAHFHEPLGRPNKFKYGKMVLRNGWFIWRVRFSHPPTKAKLKWHSTALLLIFMTFWSVSNSKNKGQAIMEGIGRFTGWLTLFFNPPKVEP